MKRLIILIICFSLFNTPAFSKQKTPTHYWIDAGVTVLVFIGDPHGLKLETVRMTTYEKQKINLFHKKSGPGLYTFYLPGLVYKDYFGHRQQINKEGYFITKRRLVRASKYKLKSSLKYKTMKGKRNEKM